MISFDFWMNFVDELNILTRAGFAFLTSCLIVLLTGNIFIRYLKRKLKLIQPIREEGPKEHFKKRGTPSLGGVLIMVAFFASSLLWLKDFNNIVKVILIVGGVFALLGLIDDLMKLKFKNSKGLSGKLRLLIGFAISIWAATVLIKEYPLGIAYSVYFPFITSYYLYIGVAIFAFIPFTVVGTANSVNLTDGLDGLASVITMTILIAFFILLFLVVKNVIPRDFAYNSVFYYAKLQEVLIIIAALVGAIFAFLWFNVSPAKIFMGDVGSLGIGGLLGIIAVATKYELFLGLVGLILIAEALSVIIQVYYYKITKKRIFLMAPLHHHFEKKGYSEVKIVQRMWLITVLFVIVALILVAKN